MSVSKPNSYTPEQCEAELAKIGAKLSAASRRLRELQIQRLELLGAGLTDKLKPVRAEIAELETEIQDCDTLNLIWTKRRDDATKGLHLQSLLDRATALAQLTGPLADRVRDQYPKAAEIIAGLLKEIDAHTGNLRQMAAIIENDKLLTKQEKKFAIDHLGKSVRFVTNGMEQTINGKLAPWWITEMVYLPKLSVGEGFHWLKPSSHNDNLRNYPILP